MVVQRKYDREMARILMDAAKEAETIIANLALDKGIGSKIRQAQLRQAQAGLRSLSGSLWGDRITPLMRRGIREAAEKGATSEMFINDVLRKRGLPTVPGLEEAYRFDAHDTARNLYARQSNGISLSRNVYKAEALSRGWVDREINRALALQMSQKELARRVKALIRPDVRGGVSYAANRLARTEINNAFHTSQIERRSAEPWTRGMQWHLSGSHPRPDECNFYALKVNFTGGGPGVFKPGETPSKPHPNCLCYLTTVTIGEQEFIDGFMDGKYDNFLRRETGFASAG